MLVTISASQDVLNIIVSILKWKENSLIIKKWKFTYFLFLLVGDESVECSPEDTEIYSDQSNKIYFATYSPSPNIFFSNSSLSRLFLILTVNEDFTPDKSQDMFVHAFDSGMSKFYIQNFNYTKYLIIYCIIVEYDIYGKNSSEYSTYDNSIYTLNSYAISPGQVF